MMRARGELGRLVVGDGQGHELTLFVVGFLVASTVFSHSFDRQRNQTLGGAAHFLGAGLPSFQCDVPQQVGNLVANHAPCAGRRYGPYLRCAIWSSSFVGLLAGAGRGRRIIFYSSLAEATG